MSFSIGLITLSVSNTGCITLTAAPFMLPTILTVTEKIPRVIWLLLVVISFVGIGFVSIGEDYSPTDGNHALKISNYKAFMQSLFGMLCFMFGGLIGTRSQILQKHAMHPTVDSALCSTIVTLFAPCFLFGDLSVNGGSLGISWLIILYGLIQGGLLWVIYRQICKTALVEK